MFKFLKIKIKGFNMQMQEIIEAIGKELGINPDTFNLMNYLSIN
ncbi:S24 family peptidase, partial [Campylobacter coli]|nr:S24 family peptidase [Campylobacter coli]